MSLLSRAGESTLHASNLSRVFIPKPTTQLCGRIAAEVHNLLSVDNLDKREHWRALILDFSCTPWIDSTAATALLEAVKTVQAAHGESHGRLQTVVLSGLQSHAVALCLSVSQATPWRSATPTHSA